MKVYIAAPWVCRAEAGGFQDTLEAAGFEVTSHWIKGHGADSCDGFSKTDDELRQEAQQDLDDLERADAFVIFNLKEKSEGKATELGYALAISKPVILVGERSRNVFYWLPDVLQVDNIEEAITVLQTLSIAAARN